MTPAELIHAVAAAWSRLENDDLCALFCEDGRFEDPLHERHLIGREDIRATNAPAMAALRSCRVTIDRVVESGDLGLAEGRFESELAGGGRMDFPFAMLVEARDGCIARLAEYFDTRPLVEA